MKSKTSTYPIYETQELNDYHDSSIFADFLVQLLKEHQLQTDQERGIVRQILAEGTSGLKGKQADVLEIIVARYRRECLCGCEIPWNEVLLSKNGFCVTHCNHLEND